MPIHPISESDSFSWPDVVTTSPLVVIYKHSPTCGASAAARDEMRAFVKSMPEIPVYQVDVLRQRGLSNTIAADLGIGHESPQVIVVCDGRAVWNTSHFRIKAATIVTELCKAGEACLLQLRDAPQAIA